jgi:hypothetical protein
MEKVLKLLLELVLPQFQWPPDSSPGFMNPALNKILRIKFSTPTNIAVNLVNGLWGGDGQHWNLVGAVYPHALICALPELPGLHLGSCLISF